MFKGHPKGLFVLSLANMGERFGYYTMLAIFVLFMQAKFGFSADATSTIFGIFLAAVYFCRLSADSSQTINWAMEIRLR